MYAIVKAGGKQYRVSENDIIEVNKLDGEAGGELVLSEVLLISDDKNVKIGSPVVAGAKVVCKIIRHYKGRKVRGYTYKPKKDSHRHYGHRQQLTSVRVEKISA